MTASSIDEYLRNQIAPRFHELVSAAAQRLAAAQRELDDLRAATGTIAWEVSGASVALSYVNIANGEMTVSERPATEPFMTISQSEDDWSRFTSGVAQTGFFSGQSRRPFGQSRINRLRTINGSVRFVVTGLPDGAAWTFTLSFGSAPRPAAPQTTVTLPADVVMKIQSGQIDPQLAFMQGQLKLSGDPGLAMQLGMALFL
jgi:putative sterol carrier protein